jgi:hypothetical protein
VYDYDLNQVVPYQGGNDRTSYFGHGFIDALATARQ